MTVLVGTRPEAIKCAPLVRALTGDPRLTCEVVGTGQHRAPVVEALVPFGVQPSRLFELERSSGSLPELAAALTTAADRELRRSRPAAVVVHGDTLTALIGGLVAFWNGIPVVHLEAGLRTQDIHQPFPEEVNRSVISRFASLHLAPTRTAALNLLNEKVPAQRIVITGNTVVDSLRYLIESGKAVPPAWVADVSHRRLVVMTLHRRENWGDGVRRICGAVRQIVERDSDTEVAVVTHPNPEVRSTLTGMLSGVRRVRLVDPLSYPSMVGLLARADLVITDSGGIQEEAATLGLRMLVTRDVTERAEVLHDGLGELVGTDPQLIVARALHALAQPNRVPLDRAPAHPALGDGRAAARAAEAIGHLLFPDTGKRLVNHEPMSTSMAMST
ncbi:UDP-N-acetylglucosamine 2-epimerase (non-hydrolyzing) [Solwaraspora sp. WMMD406]|uniref:non-hydrolyzing UDP-N-acetylglucosamine 2-epimerase n=1 Tax=Solwaraspora sp. WMMD406 TaxID=3016095 RepID=UPI00241799BF|nr:UDP-N-acetylglucosamine 2-epimerase (non-hydrolyzing) [Solwaraspora sp. WMMD406]MDG4767032.1 UDP-N-acetylglucosamine 2-epimerase (non-hydrolyzing) [Solwaraspora sp. WMMD406]